MWEGAAERIAPLAAGSPVKETTEREFWRAVDLATRHPFQIWDAVIVAAAESAGCDIRLSEDMHHGFRCGGLIIVNPFERLTHPLLLPLPAR